MIFNSRRRKPSAPAPVVTVRLLREDVMAIRDRLDREADYLEIKGGIVEELHKASVKNLRRMIAALDDGLKCQEGE
jgi:hypothetical protein